MKTNFDLVGEFHHKFDLLTLDGPPTRLTDELFMFRFQFLLEEVHELLEAHREGSIEKAADALADLLYVAYGTAHLMSIPIDDVFREVHRANMTKVRAKADGSDSKRGSSHDVVKPEGWQPPDVRTVMLDYLRRNGYASS